MRRAIAFMIAAGLAALVGGFALFLLQVPGEEVAIDRNADGIVVLTGGALRVVDAIDLLAAGRGRRLLITGVNPATNPGELARAMPSHERVIACCIDLDYSALNTIGNAIETRRWAKSRGFRSLIVVTSDYHMPRAMAEIAHQLPDVALIPFPVVTEQRRSEPWWSNPASARLILWEYLKYIFASIRIRLDSIFMS
jgi:uncharacterized SAM-binding protein YcdF (DUF218 family)